MVETLIRRPVARREGALSVSAAGSVLSDRDRWHRTAHVSDPALSPLSDPHPVPDLRKDGTILYYHPVLEAKLVTANGFAFSLMTEFIENAPPPAGPQDCELKAFYRSEIGDWPSA